MDNSYIGIESKVIKINDLYFELQVSEIIHRGDRLIGRFIELIDRTDKAKYAIAIQKYNENLEKIHLALILNRSWGKSFLNA